MSWKSVTSCQSPILKLSLLRKLRAASFKMRHVPQVRILKREAAETVVNAAQGFEGPLSVRVEDKRQGPPKLHDLPSLQKLCGSRFGWPASKTLAVAQELSLLRRPGQEDHHLSARRGALPAAQPDIGRTEDRGRAAGGPVVPRNSSTRSAVDPQGSERYNETRTHLGLSKDAPRRRAVQLSGTIVTAQVLSGLHHRYMRI